MKGHWFKFETVTNIYFRTTWSYRRAPSQYLFKYGSSLVSFGQYLSQRLTFILNNVKLHCIASLQYYDTYTTAIVEIIIHPRVV